MGRDVDESQLFWRRRFLARSERLVFRGALSQLWRPLRSPRTRLLRCKMAAPAVQIPREDESMAAHMTKTQLVRTMAEKLELTNKQAATFLETLADL